MDTGYASAMTPASAHLAHRCRLLMTRTVSQTQNAAKAIPRIDRAMAMPGI
jgi:hypothetical protein